MDQYNRVKGLKGDGEGLRELKQLKGTEELGLEGTEKLNTEGLDTPM